MDTRLTQYIRDKRNNKIGVMVAELIGDDIRIAVSRCHKKDRFNRDLGLKIATGRLEYKDPNNHLTNDTPTEIMNQFHSFENRAKRYFRRDQQ